MTLQYRLASLDKLGMRMTGDGHRQPDDTQDPAVRVRFGCNAPLAIG